MGRQVFTAGEILTAANMNDLGDATVMVFDDATARATAIPTPVEGMVTYLEDVGGAQGLEVFDGSVFTPVAIVPDPPIPPEILQVVQTVKTDIFSTTSGTLTDVTGLNATITPTSASSKILFSAVVPVSATGTNAGQGVLITALRGSTFLFTPTARGTRTPAMALESPTETLGMVSVAFSFLDSPATTSPTTYKIQVLNRTGGDTAFVNRSRSDLDTTNAPRGVSTITLMEVAG